MKSVQDQFKTFNETKAFLKKIALNGVNSELKTMAYNLHRDLPDSFDTDMMFRLLVEWKERDCKHSPDPVEYSPTEGGWIFWDETWTICSEPYGSKQEALDGCERYSKDLG